MKSKRNKKRLEAVNVSILKMKESSGNEQFFVRLLRNDMEEHDFFGKVALDYSCWQTKHLDKKECLSRAWFDASHLAGFSGLDSMDDVVLTGLDEEEIKVLKKSLALSF